MKRNCLTTLIFLLIFGGVHAQGISIGFKGGVNIASQEINLTGLTFPRRSLLAYHVGLYATSMFNRRIGIQAECQYSIQGNEIYGGTTTKAIEKYEYINVPVLFRVNFASAFNFYLGPQGGVCLSANNTYGNITTDMKSDVNSLDFAFVTGMGFDAGSINGGLRYNLGLTNISKTELIKNNVLQIYIGVRLTKT